MYKNEELKDRIERINRLKELYPTIESGVIDWMENIYVHIPGAKVTENTINHMKDRMFESFMEATYRNDVIASYSAAKAICTMISFLNNLFTDTVVVPTREARTMYVEEAVAKIREAAMNLIPGEQVVNEEDVEERR